MAVVVEFDSNDVVAVANAAELVFTGGTAITANGSQIVLLGVRELIVNLLANVKSLGAGATIVFSIQEIDPIDAANAIATVLASQPKVSTGVFSSAGTDSASSGGGRAGTEALSATSETRALTSEMPSRAAQTALPQGEMRSIDPKTRAPEPQTHTEKSLTERLVALFGKGNSPSLRMTLYIRIQLIWFLKLKKTFKNLQKMTMLL